MAPSSPSSAAPTRASARKRAASAKSELDQQEATKRPRKVPAKKPKPAKAPGRNRKMEPEDDASAEEPDEEEMAMGEEDDAGEQEQQGREEAPAARKRVAQPSRVTLASNGSRVYGFAFLDYAALKIWVGSLHDDDSSAALGALLVQLTRLSGIDFSDASQIRMLVHSQGYFKASTDSWLSGLDYSVNQDATICALGGLIGHLTRLMLEDALKNGEVLPYHVYKTCLRMDGQTLVNLEIFSNNFDGGSSGTLYRHLNNCITASGKRLLRRWICHPLKDVSDINTRLDIVEGFIQNCGLGSITLEHLRKIPDLERLLGLVRSTVGLSSAVLLPFVGEKILKRRIKTFGMLIKGLRIRLVLWPFHMVAVVLLPVPVVW